MTEPKFEIKESSNTFLVFDLLPAEARWLATFQFFKDAKAFVDSQMSQPTDSAQTPLDPDDKSLSNIADWLEQKGVVGSAKIVRKAALALRTNAQAPSDLARRHDAEMADVTGQLFDAWNEIKALKASAQARPDCGAMRAQWTYDPEVHAYYFAPLQAAAPPYNTREVTAIIDIANDGTLAGVELIDNMPPPPSPLSSTHQRETYCALCDREHQLHEDAQGFHHVIKGERVACPVSPADQGGAA